MRRNKTKLKLPFKGKWLVFWGGDSKKLNAHHEVENQRYAFDFVMVDREGKEYEKEGNENQDYYSFGQEVLAPADGEIIEAFDGVEDTPPGTMRSYLAEGNAVIIKHREDEFSVLAHLRQKTVKVEVGEEVKQGEIIAQCGDSGNSSEPHLHYHLQDGLIPQQAEGIKCYFSNLKLRENSDFIFKEECSPVKGDVVAPVNSE